MRDKRKRWEFLWWRDEDYPCDKKVKARWYVAPTIEKACDKMLRFIQSRDFTVVLDHEALAEHVRYDPRRHQQKYPNLLELNHPIREYV